MPAQLLPRIGDMMSFFWPQSIENRAAFRTAIAALAAILISFSLHLKTPYWSGMTVVIVANLYTGSIIDKAMMRIMGTIAGAFLGFYLAGLVVNSLLLYFLSCFVVISLSVYYYNLSPYGYAYLLSSVSVFLVIAQLAIEPQNAFFVAIWRPVEIALGVIVSALCAYSIFPNHLKDSIPEQAAAIIDDFLLELKQLSKQIDVESSTFNVVLATNLEMKRKIRKAVELIGVMRRELGIKQETIDELRAFLDLSYQSARQLQYLVLSTPKTEDFSLLKSLPLNPLFDAAQNDLLAIKQAFLSQKNVTSTTELTNPLHKFKEVISNNGSVIRSDFVFSLLSYFDQLHGSLQIIHLLLSHQPVAILPKERVLTSHDRMQGDVDLIKHSIKAGLAVILALVFWMMSHWPGGLNGIISSLLISIRKNLYDMKNISIHRVLGCLLGGGIALISLAIFEMNLTDFCIVIFLSVWAMTYLMFKFPKYAYVGLQGNIALIISLAQDGGPPVLLDPPLQRLGGIFIGIIASFIVANMLWRADALTVLQRYIHKLSHYMQYNIVQLLQFKRGERQLHDLANIFWNARGLIEELSEEELSSKKHKLLTELRTQFDSLVMKQAILSHIGASVDRELAAATAKELSLDLLDLEQSLMVRSHTALKSRVDEMLKIVRSHLDRSQIEPKALNNLVDYLNALKLFCL